MGGRFWGCIGGEGGRGTGKGKRRDCGSGCGVGGLFAVGC